MMVEKLNEKKIINTLLKLYQAKDYKNLERESLKYVDKFPQSPALLNLIAASKSYLGKHNESIEYFKKICSLQPKEAQNYSNVGKALHDIRKDFEAIEYFDKALNLKPNDVNILAQVGYIYVEKLMPEKAINYLKKAANIKSTPQIIFMLGDAYRLLGDQKKALENFSKALNLDPEMPQAHYRLGMLFKEKGNYEQSLKHLEISDNYNDSKERIIETKYLMEDYQGFEKDLENLSTEKDSNILLQLISSHASINLNKKDNYNFCSNPFEMILHENIADLKKGSYFLLQLLQDLKNSEIQIRHQDLLYNGSQSSGNLFDIQSKSIKKLKEIIIDQINMYKLKNSESSANMIKKWPEKSILNGWYVNMNKGGYLDPHIHENGWISGSVYLKMPEDSDENEGCIEFSFEGKDLPNLGDKGPKRKYKPLIGDIILFPSSLAHKTTPFESKEKRICVAFDLNPL